MKVLIDTNVILDVLTQREPHIKFSAQFLRLCGANVTGCITVSQTTDIFYLLRRFGKDAQSAKDIIKKLTVNIKTLDVTNADFQNAMAAEMPDYEDALLAYCAKRHKAEYIVTRNESDFGFSPVPAVSPQSFLDSFFRLKNS
jgi:predicted nucleic acid-binding protein